METAINFGITTSWPVCASVSDKKQHYGFLPKDTVNPVNPRIHVSATRSGVCRPPNKFQIPLYT